MRKRAMQEALNQRLGIEAPEDTVTHAHRFQCIPVGSGIRSAGSQK
jgi:hypothetical protein